MSELVVTACVEVIRGEDPTRLRLPDTIPAPDVTASALDVPVRVNVVLVGDPTLVYLLDTTPDLPVPVSLVFVKGGLVG